jgi:hypothetical protein
LADDLAARQQRGKAEQKKNYADDLKCQHASLAPCSDKVGRDRTKLGKWVPADADTTAKTARYP